MVSHTCDEVIDEATTDHTFTSIMTWERCMLTMFKGSIGNIALVLGALTAGGGITGYVRTGSVPSVAAGVTVGVLV